MRRWERGCYSSADNYCARFDQHSAPGTSVTVGDEATTTVHYHVTSHAGTAAEIVGLIRGHWGIESMHGVWNVVFREDHSRVRAGHAGENVALIRRVAVSLLRRAPVKGSTPTKRLNAGWNDECLLQVLQGIQAPEVR